MNTTAGAVADQNAHYTNNAIEVQDYDILLGRGKLYDNHIGNLNFRSKLERFPVPS
jgi:hypothetical protein